MKRLRKRKCLGCGEGFIPNHRNRDKQEFCGKSGCVKLSAKKSRAKWAAKNPDYFKGRENVLRVRQWRQDNPGYWRRKKGGLRSGTLQEDWIPQGADKEEESATLKHFALQENWFSQPALYLGLIADLTGSALQEDIVTSVVNLHKRGQEILGIPLRVVPKTKT